MTNNLREFQNVDYSETEQRIMMRYGLVSVGKTNLAEQIMHDGKAVGGSSLEQGTHKMIITGVDILPPVEWDGYTNNLVPGDSDNLLEAMALTIDSLQNAKVSADDFRSALQASRERIPVTTGNDLYTISHGGKGGKMRGPKGGGAQRLMKRRAKNKAARKARRHG